MSSKHTDQLGETLYKKIYFHVYRENKKVFGG